jgi:class I fructose-bisphosphate aldolase
MGRIGLINSGGESGRRQRFRESGQDRGDQQARRRHGHDLGSQGIQRPMEEGIKLLNIIQDVYLDPAITIA